MEMGRAKNVRCERSHHTFTTISSPLYIPGYVHILQLSSFASSNIRHQLEATALVILCLNALLRAHQKNTRTSDSISFPILRYIHRAMKCTQSLSMTMLYTCPEPPRRVPLQLQPIYHTACTVPMPTSIVAHSSESLFHGECLVAVFGTTPLFPGSRCQYTSRTFSKRSVSATKNDLPAG